MALQLGFHIGQQNLTILELRQLWTRLDQQGADWISLWDHFYEAPPAGGSQDHFEAIALLGALATETEKARLGCLVFYVGYRNPALLAKAAATLDHLSGGRFEIGLGAGWHIQEATAYGYPFPKVGTYHRKGLRLMPLLTGSSYRKNLIPDEIPDELLKTCAKIGGREALQLLLIRLVTARIYKKLI